LKKHLLSTSAIALGVAMAAPASAQDWNMKWGGFANTHVGITSVDRNFAAPGIDNDGVNIFTNSEIIFSPSVTLDNGMTFGFSVQMEALNAGGGADGIDESYVTISSDTLGKLVLGSENSAGYALMGSVYTPGVSSMAINSRSTSAFVPVTGSGGFRQAGLSSLTEVAGNNDVQRITYFTPSFNGLTVGVSYAPSNAGNASNNAPVNFNSAANVVDIFDLGVGYKQSFNGVDIGLAGRWGTGDSNVAGISDPTTWGIGGTVGVAGFKVGATYAENDNGAATGAGDQEGWSLGMSYDIAGPWTVGLSHYNGEVKNGGATPSSDYEATLLGASRSLGSGVSWDVYYYYMETTNGTNGRKIDGNVLATAINLSF
jgi:predicted porin